MLGYIKLVFLGLEQAKLSWTYSGKLQAICDHAWVKGMTGEIHDEDAEEVLKPVLVRFDDQFQLAFEVDRTADGLVAVYLPGSPDPRSGAVSYVTGDRIQPAWPWRARRST